MHIPVALDTPAVSGSAIATGVLRHGPEDFRVIEVPVCEPEGEGEHSWLYVRKCNANTEWVARQLAKHAGVGRRHVSYAGLKDRAAVTEQWFSVHLPGKPDPDWQSLQDPEFEILTAKRHHRKLRRGALRGNRFQIRLRELQGDRDTIAQRLESIKQNGMPNYFGPQRFGVDGHNIAAAEEMFSKPANKISRHKRGLYLSAARALLFNQVLSQRVSEDLWNQALPGDVLQLDGRRGRFLAESVDLALSQRLAALEIHPTGPLWGQGDALSRSIASEMEWRILEPYQSLREGLEAAGLEQDRRALRVRAEQLEWDFQDPDILVLRFTLPAGSYGTVLLREFLAAA